MSDFLATFAAICVVCVLVLALGMSFPLAEHLFDGGHILAGVACIAGALVALAGFIALAVTER